MSFLIASQIALWVGLLVLGVICIALARQIGVLHQRIAPAGALSLRQPLKLGDLTPQMVLPGLDGSSVQIGGLRGGRSQLLLFISPDCTVCDALLPAVRSATSMRNSSNRKTWGNFPTWCPSSWGAVTAWPSFPMQC
jgi:methylamine dehydrogenase accessory protein MauD